VEGFVTPTSWCAVRLNFSVCLANRIFFSTYLPRIWNYETLWEWVTIEDERLTELNEKAGFSSPTIKDQHPK